MSEVNFIAQPSARTTLDAIEAIAKASDLTKLDIAVAYATSSGTHDLLKRIDAALGADWVGVKKRWITSFDYCRTQPIALESLLSLPESSVRVYDAPFCLAHSGMPKVPFHPKTFLFRGKDKDFALAGSGNLSRSGLSKGVEVGLAISVTRKTPAEPTSAAAIKALRRWYKATWQAATPLNGGLLKQYVKLFESVPNLAHPTPTEDDLASDKTSKGALSSKDLQKLRVCSHFWIEAGNLGKNLGPNRPGNQLMMKRLSRVFFGVPPIDVPQNSPLTHMKISFDGNEERPCSLTFSDNGMDKLTLPAPGFPGPAKYDNKNLLFKRTGADSFILHLGTAAQKSTWLKRSKAIDANFSMSSGGRIWGVF